MITIENVIDSMRLAAQKTFINSQRNKNLADFVLSDGWQDAAIQAADAFFKEIHDQVHADAATKAGYGLMILAGQHPCHNRSWKRGGWDSNSSDVFAAMETAALTAGTIALRVQNLPNRIRMKINNLKIKDPTPQSSHGENIASTKTDNKNKYFNEDYINSELTEDGIFDPKNDTDARKLILRSIVQRAGQARFRDQLLKAYDSCCAVTGCPVVAVLEAAHILPYKGEHTNHVTNGILLRADIHTLFDLGLMSIDPETYRVILDETIRASAYEEFHGKPISLPKDEALQPDKKALAMRWDEQKPQ